MKTVRYFLLFGMLCFVVTAKGQANPSQAHNIQPDSSQIIRICAPSKGQLLKPILYVIYRHNKIYFQDTITQLKKGAIANINPNDIQKIEVLKDEKTIAQYGDRGKNGVILIYLKDSSKIKTNK